MTIKKKFKKILVVSILTLAFLTHGTGAFASSVPELNIYNGVFNASYTTLKSTNYEFLKNIKIKTYKQINSNVNAEDSNVQESNNNTNNNNDNSTTGSSMINLGQFKITYYCTCSKCCGNSKGITASGVKAIPYKSIAVDKKVIPLGSTVIINGKEYIAHDTGGAIKGNRIDICVSSHSEALKLGKTYANVYIKK